MLENSDKSAGPLNLPLVAQSLDYTCGAACFESMFRHLRGQSFGELYFAEKLNSLKLGHTPPESIIELAKSYQFNCIMTEGSKIDDLRHAFSRREVIFITWWDEDAGHYSLIENLANESITLMDPWTAREGLINFMILEDFLPMWKIRGAKMIRVF